MFTQQVQFQSSWKVDFFWTKIGIVAKCVALIMFWYKEIRGCIDIVVLVAAKLETVVTALWVLRRSTLLLAWPLQT